MSYLGSWKIDDLLTFPANTHRFDTGVATDADSVPSYRVYEDETATPILTGSMALLDSTNTAGFYSEQITLSAANGFEKGKSYTIYISATVNSVVGTTSKTFQIEAEVDANTVSPTVSANAIQISGDSAAADNAEAFFDGTGYVGTNNTIPTVTTLTNLPAITSNWLTAAGIAAGALNGKGDWNIGKTGYALSSAGVQAIWDALTSALTTASSIGKLLVDNINATISSRATPAQVNTEVVDVLTVDLIADSYAADGAQPTIAQALLLIQQFLTEKSVTGTTVTVKKPNGSTSAFTLTLDSSTTPTSITRAT